MAAVKRDKSSFKVALGGIITAFSLVIMFATGFIPIGTYTFPALAGILLISVVVELGAKWAFAVYTAIAILSVIITPDKEAALLFIFFFGHYPIIKSFLERVKNKAIEWIVKFCVFNICILTCYAIIFYVFQMQYVIESFKGFGQLSLLLFLIAGNIAFLLYDVALTNLVTFYIKWIRVKILKRL